MDYFDDTNEDSGFYMYMYFTPSSCFNGVDYFDDTNENSGFYMYMYFRLRAVVLMVWIILMTPMKIVVSICTCISDSE